ncbi:ABC transporter transmembrane domain-containing protein [Buchnera aphidicola]|uniref:ABC transporter transmembrane domain-containing protein n=1 Tax=Buchnera aphidicola TaxID=9 RepID=UPI003463B268
MKLFNQLGWYFLKEWKSYLGSIITLIIISILQLLPPKIIGILVDLAIQHTTCTKKIFYWIGAIFLTAIITYILKYIWKILLFDSAYKLAIILRVKLYSYLNKKNSEFYIKYRTGDLMARATNDIDRIVFTVGEGMLTLTDSVITGISVLTIMIFQINWKLTVISLIPMPIMTIIIAYYGKKIHYAFKKSQSEFSNLNNQTQENLKNIYMIKGFGLEQQKLQKFKKIAQENSKKNIEVAKIDSKFDPIIYFAIALSNVLAISIGSYLVWNHSITIGQLTSFIMYLGLMVWPMLALAWMFNIIERGSASWNRINEIMNKKFFIKDGNEKILDKNNTLTIKIFEFYYENNKTFKLKNIFFTIKPNDIIGICGPIGGGKTTLIHLIQRNFNISKGYILCNSHYISNISIKTWRKKINIVNQLPFLFSDTIQNNIKLGNIHASQSEIEYAASIAEIHNDILNLPNGYQTEVGEQGIILSGGQKQRICIARALLLQSEFLILDDALSAIDEKTQRIILNNIKAFKKTYNTLIIISHKLSLLKSANNILIMKNGYIHQQGTHNQLMKSKNWYSNTYNQQKKPLHNLQIKI